MKSFFKKILNSYKKLSFLQGVALTICLTSFFSIAATNLPGFFVFSPGTPISSSEINDNFEKVAGKIVLKANLSSSFNGDDSSFSIPSDCPSCHVFRKKINFDSILINDSNIQTGTDTDPSSSSYNGSFTYYQIPTNGWYEIRFTPSATVGFTNASCTASNCSVNVSASFSVNLVNSLSLVSSNSYTNVAYTLNSKYQSDTGGTPGILNSITPYTDQPPEIKRVYLKSGQILFVKFEANYNQNNASANYTFSVAPNSIDLTIIRL